MAHRKFRKPQACIVFVPYGSLDIEADIAALKVTIKPMSATLDAYDISDIPLCLSKYI